MKESRVKEIYIKNRSLFEELFIKELIRRNINYLQINHEFHVFDKIYRIIKPDEINNNIKPKLDKNAIEIIISEPVEEKPKKEIYKYNKKLIKRNNYVIKKQLKNNKR